MAELRAIGRDGRIASGYFDGPAKLADGGRGPRRRGRVHGDLRHAQPRQPRAPRPPREPRRAAARARRTRPRPTATSCAAAGSRSTSTRSGRAASRPPRRSTARPARRRGGSATGSRRRAGPRRSSRTAGTAATSSTGSTCRTTTESTALVKAVLAALDERFSTAEAKVDTANFNAARIWKCYGTVEPEGRLHEGPAAPAIGDRGEAVRAGGRARRTAPGARGVAATRRRTAASPTRPYRPGGPAIDLRRLARRRTGLPSRPRSPGRAGRSTPSRNARSPTPTRTAPTPSSSRTAPSTPAASTTAAAAGRQRWQELRARLEPAYAVSRRHRPRAVRRPRTGPTRRPRRPRTPPNPGRTRPSSRRRRRSSSAATPSGTSSTASRGTTSATRRSPTAWSCPSRPRRSGTRAGLHVYVTGESGKGKSSGMTAMLRQVPEEYRLAERMSNKALYYSDDISPGTVLLLDDIALSEELQEVLKEATSKFAEPVRMRSVDKDRKVRRCTIPERCVWWLANVSALYDDQVLNRMLVCWVDDSEEQDREVFRAARWPSAPAGRGDRRDRFDLLVCRELWRRLRADGPRPRRDPVRRTASAWPRSATAGTPRSSSTWSGRHALLLRRQRRARAARRTAGSLVDGDRGRLPVRGRGSSPTSTRTGGSLEAEVRPERGARALARGAERRRAVHAPRRAAVDGVAVPRRPGGSLLGYVDRGRALPGAARPVAGALAARPDGTSEDDEDGRDVKPRQLVFLFDAELHRAPAPRAWSGSRRSDRRRGPRLPPTNSDSLLSTGTSSRSRRPQRHGTANGENCAKIDLSVVVHGDHIQLRRRQGDAQLRRAA